MNWDVDIFISCTRWWKAVRLYYHHYKIESFFPAEEEFEDLCFDYGLELDEVVSNIYPFIISSHYFCEMIAM